MSRHLLQRLAVWTAFAVALLFPLVLFPQSAGAAILPLCEVDAATVMPRVPPPSPLAFAAAEEPTPSCDEVSRLNNNAVADDDIVDPKIAAYCDARGASAIAPQRIVPITDARIEATPSCARLDISTQTIAPSPHDGPAMGSAALALDPAALDPSTLVHPASSELLPDYAPVTDVDCSGIERSVYHPPR
ncbi:MAG: hypothetical protein ABJE95_07295 [Byssovorax sp.]